MDSKEYYKKNREKILGYLKKYRVKYIKEYRRGRGRAAWNESKRRNYERGATHQHNARVRWGKWEVDLILTSDKTDRELALELGRTVKAIQMKRTKVLAVRVA